MGASFLDPPPAVWGAPLESNKLSRPGSSRPAEQAIGSLYNEILREQLGQIERRSGAAGLFDREYHSNVANRKR